MVRRAARAASRSFDANGQYSARSPPIANYAYPLDDGRFFFNTLPLRGVNPPRAGEQPPVAPDVPCETQEPPDLRSPALPPPPRWPQRTPALKVDRRRLGGTCREGEPATSQRSEALGGDWSSRALLMKAIRKHQDFVRSSADRVVSSSLHPGTSGHALPVVEEGTVAAASAEFSTAQAVVPGQGQTMRVAGVRDGGHRRAPS